MWGSRSPNEGHVHRIWDRIQPMTMKPHLINLYSLLDKYPLGSQIERCRCFLADGEVGWISEMQFCVCHLAWVWRQGGVIPSSSALGELVLQRLYKKSQTADCKLCFNEFGATITTWMCSVNKNHFGHTNLGIKMSYLSINRCTLLTKFYYE